MTKTDRVRLLFGPYQTPEFEYGDVVEDARRGPVKIVELSDGPIPWPIGVPADQSRLQRRAIVLYGVLVEAVRRESVQAVTYWWRVPIAAVSHRRRLLGVPRVTEGTRRLLVENWAEFGEMVAVAALPVLTSLEHRQMLAKLRRDPVVSEKIAASKRGKKRPPHVVALMRQRALSTSSSTKWSTCWSGTTTARFIAILDEHLPQWRSHRYLLNSTPLAHETWKY